MFYRRQNRDIERTGQALDTAAFTMCKHSYRSCLRHQELQLCNTIMNFSVGPDTSEDAVKVFFLKFAANYLNKNATHYCTRQLFDIGKTLMS